MADQLPPTGAVPGAIDQVELTAAARESFGFADDQFMELSTSGASIYGLLPILSDPSSSSSGRLSRVSEASSNSSLKRALLDQRAPAGGATPQGGIGSAPARAAQSVSLDESSLSISGMSLASLGSLSRSSRRLHMLEKNVDEALDDSRAWGDVLVGSSTAMGQSSREEEERSAARSSTAYRKSNSDGRQGVIGVGGGASVAMESGSTPNMMHGEGGIGANQGASGDSRVLKLSSGITELRRQQSYSRRMASMAQRRNDVPPPPPVGVDLASPLPPPPIGVDRALGPPPTVVSSSSPTEDTFATIGNLSNLPPSRNRDCEMDGGGGGSGGGNSSASSASRSPSHPAKSKRKSRRPAAVGRALLRTIGRRATKSGDGAARAGAIAPPGAGGLGVETDVDWASVTTSWSNESSLQGRGSSASPANAIGASPCKVLKMRARSASSAVTTSAEAASIAEGVEKSKLGRAGLRERIAGVWGRGWRGSSKRDHKGEADVQGTSGSPLGPNGEVEGSSIFRDGIPAGIGREPNDLPHWFRGHSAPVGPMGDVLPVDSFTVAFPTTPLGTSNRSFDANLAMSPSTFDADDSSVSVARSFDPNSSVKSLFDMSLSGRKSAGAWPDEQQQLNGRESSSPAVRDPLSSTTSTSAPKESDISAAAKAQGEEVVGQTAGPQRGAARGEELAASAQAAVAAAAAQLEEEQLAQELSDLSVSASARDDESSTSKIDPTARANDLLGFSEAGIAALTAEELPDTKDQLHPLIATNEHARGLATMTSSPLSKGARASSAPTGNWQSSPLQAQQTLGIGWSTPAHQLAAAPGERPRAAAGGGGGGGGGDSELDIGPVVMLKVARPQSADLEGWRRAAPVHHTHGGWLGPEVGTSGEQCEAGGGWIGGGVDRSPPRPDSVSELLLKQSSSSSLDLPPTPFSLGIERSLSADNTDHSTSGSRIKRAMTGIDDAAAVGAAGSSGSADGGGGGVHQPPLFWPDGRPYKYGSTAKTSNAATLAMFATAPAAGGGISSDLPASATAPSPLRGHSGSGATGANAPFTLPPSWWPGLASHPTRVGTETPGVFGDAQKSSNGGSVVVVPAMGDGGSGGGGGIAEGLAGSSSTEAEGKKTEAWSALQAMIPMPGLAKPKPKDGAVASGLDHGGAGSGSDVGAVVGTGGGTGGEGGPEVGHTGEGEVAGLSEQTSGWGALASLG